MTHELMHALGFFHEHTRPDRDKFVRILWDNIKNGNVYSHSNSTQNECICTTNVRFFSRLRDKFASSGIMIIVFLIAADHLSEFEIRARGESTTLGQPYDFQSIMHYTKKEFSSNGGDTIQAIVDPSMPLGNVNSLSAVDVMQTNLLYKCPEGLRQGKTKCTQFIWNVIWMRAFQN